MHSNRNICPQQTVKNRTQINFNCLLLRRRQSSLGSEFGVGGGISVASVWLMGSEEEFSVYGLSPFVF